MRAARDELQAGRSEPIQGTFWDPADPHGGACGTPSADLAHPSEGFAVVFFPDHRGVAEPTLASPRVTATLSSTEDAAVAKFVDGFAVNQPWGAYREAGYRVRRVRLVDLGDA